MGKVCIICGAAALEIDYNARTVTVKGEVFKEGDFLSIDGTAGSVYAGQLKTSPSEIITGLIEGNKTALKTEKVKNFKQLMDWCSKVTKLDVRTNADTPEQTETAIAFGANGIGLTRTEHMFFEGNRIDAMREMILATDEASRRAALAKLLPYQRAGLHRHLQSPQRLPSHHPPPRSATPRVPATHQGAANGPRPQYRREG
jgi:pyruvate,orthophosphate dikinase